MTNSAKQIVCSARGIAPRRSSIIVPDVAMAVLWRGQTGGARALPSRPDGIEEILRFERNWRIGRNTGTMHGSCSSEFTKAYRAGGPLRQRLARREHPPLQSIDNVPFRCRFHGHEPHRA